MRAIAEMDSIRTLVGRARDGDYDSFGLRVFRDLLGQTSYLGLIAFAITGRRLSREDEDVLDDLAVASHVPEPRVWPMKLARVVASLGRMMPGMLASATILDSDLLGGRVARDAAQALLDLEAYLGEHGDDDAQIATFVRSRPRFVGFGVPFRQVDERVVALRSALSRRDRLEGRYWKLAERFWRIVGDERGVAVNIIGATAALTLDLGMSPAQISAMAVMLLQPTLLANAFEGANQAAPILARLPDEAVRYVGPPLRRSPRKGAQKAP